MSRSLKTREDEDGRGYLTNVRNGDYVAYRNVNFADGTANGTSDKRLILSVNARLTSLAGGTVEVRLDHLKKVRRKWF